uniref:Caspase family p20 domain-containing protein n=2 Tax=Graphocephala atropunctata TaxID=36148 RepID=A0A1B6MSE2_9HEMI
MNFRNGYPKTASNFFEQDWNFEDLNNLSQHTMNMGNRQGVATENYNNKSGSSTSDSEDDNDVTTDNCTSFETNRRNFDQDFAQFSSPVSEITFQIVEKIERDVDLNDMISLIFLLFDSYVALQEIFSMLRNYEVHGQRNVVNDKLSAWARHQAHNQPASWRMKLLEGLAVLQSYDILQKLGYSRDRVDNEFCPRSNETRFLDKAKKMLFLLCDRLSGEQAIQLITLVRVEAKFADDITVRCNTINMELHILFWLTQDVISIDKEVNVSCLIKYLKIMGLSDIAVSMEGVANQLNEDKCSSEEKCVYEIINPQNVGLLVIINMIEFEDNVEKRPEYKHLLPDPKLPDRVGSLEDVTNLKGLFTCHLKFKVVHESDIKHDDLINEIKKMISEHFVKGEHSVLFLCLLSHGKEGSIYGVNSIPVPIDDIKNIFHDGTSVANMLVGVPKVLIIQACQGNNHLYGSKYIQELCRCLKKYYQHKHFTDIVIRVHNNINKQDMHVNVQHGQGQCREHDNCVNMYMTPSIRFITLRKDLYLTKRNMKM